MVEIPQQMSKEDFMSKLARWEDMSRRLKELKVAEIMLRKELFGEAFPSPEEGTLYYPLGGGWKLQGKYILAREVDTTMIGHMRDAMQAIGHSVDPLLNWKVELRVSEYKKLPEQARSLFDNIVTTKEGSPQLVLAPPKDNEVPPVEQVHSPDPVIASPEQVETPSVTLDVAPPKKKRASRKKTT